MCWIFTYPFKCLWAIITCQIVTCAVETMKAMLVAINMFFGAVGILVITIGAMIMQNVDLIDTYGEGVKDIGVAFIILGIFTVLCSMCGMCGVKSLNKKYLLGYCAILMIILCCEVGFASYAIENANSGTVYNLCVLKNSTTAPIDPSTGEIVDCSNFQQNSLRLGSYFLWQALWNDAQLYHSDMVKYKSKKTQYVFLQHLQESGRCCGFGKPIEIEDVSLCQPNPARWNVQGESIPYQTCYGYTGGSTTLEGADPPTYAGPASVKGLYCSHTPNAGNTFATSNCGQDDPSAAVSVAAAASMKYDFPMGDCVARCHAYGCAEAMYSYVERHMKVLGLIVLIVVLVNVIALAIAICILCARHTGLDDHHDRQVAKQGKDTEMV